MYIDQKYKIHFYKSIVNGYNNEHKKSLHFAIIANITRWTLLMNIWYLYKHSNKYSFYYTLLKSWNACQYTNDIGRSKEVKSDGKWMLLGAMWNEEISSRQKHIL